MDTAGRASSATLLPPRQLAVHRATWLAIAAGIALCLAITAFAGLSLKILYIPQFLFIMGACAAISAGYRYIYRDDNMFLFGNVMNQFICAGFAISLAVNLCTMFNLPLIDESLIAWDRKFGFDWLSYIAWLDRQPLLISIFTFCYQTFTVWIVVLVCALFIARQSAQAQRFILAFYVAGMITAVISGLMPAVAGFAHYNMNVGGFVHLHPAAGRIHEAIVLKLRSHELRTFTFPGIGIVTFPSFHSTGAVLLIYATLFLRYLRLVMIPLNILMLLSIPGDGGHYLVDVLGGIFVAFLGMAAAERILPRRSVTNATASL